MERYNSDFHKDKPNNISAHPAEMIETDSEVFSFTEAQKAYMDKTNSLVRRFLDSNELIYSICDRWNDYTFYDFRQVINNLNFRMRIHICADITMCRIEAYLPIYVDSANELAISSCIATTDSLIAKFNITSTHEVTGSYTFFTNTVINYDSLTASYYQLLDESCKLYKRIRDY